MTPFENASEPQSALPPGTALMGLPDVQEYVAIVCMLCGADPLVARIRVAWNGRFSARMGDARWSDRQGLGFIRLSSRLWPKAGHDERVETITHEACHVIADYTFGGRQMHGPRWREMMRRCGYEEPRRCHRVDLDAIHARRFGRRLRAACGCPGGVLITPVTARRLRAGTTYLCRACRVQIILPPAGRPT